MTNLSQKKRTFKKGHVAYSDTVTSNKENRLGYRKNIDRYKTKNKKKKSTIL